MKMARKFRPRNPIPKKKIIEYLDEGLTLEEIGNKHNRSRSYVSELIKMYNIDLNDIEDRDSVLKQRREEKKYQSFIDALYSKVEGELD